MSRTFQRLKVLFTCNLMTAFIRKLRGSNILGIWTKYILFKILLKKKKHHKTTSENSYGSSISSVRIIFLIICETVLPVSYLICYWLCFNRWMFSKCLPRLCFLVDFLYVTSSETFTLDEYESRCLPSISGFFSITELKKNSFQYFWNKVTID